MDLRKNIFTGRKTAVRDQQSLQGILPCAGTEGAGLMGSDKRLGRLPRAEAS